MAGGEEAAGAAADGIKSSRRKNMREELMLTVWLKGAGGVNELSRNNELISD